MPVRRKSPAPPPPRWVAYVDGDVEERLAYDDELTYSNDERVRLTTAAHVDFSPTRERDVFEYTLPLRRRRRTAYDDDDSDDDVDDDIIAFPWQARAAVVFFRADNTVPEYVFELDGVLRIARRGRVRGRLTPFTR